MEQKLNKENSLERRRALPEDKEFARTVHHRAYHDVVVKQFGNWDEAKQDAFFDTAWESEPFEILECDGVPCGLLAIEDHGEYIEPRELVLLPEFQGRGIGTKVLAEVIASAKERAVPIKIQALRENEALKLYRKLGFKDSGETETHMQLEFNPVEPDKETL